jgi:hypothetical protein
VGGNFFVQNELKKTPDFHDQIMTSGPWVHQRKHLLISGIELFEILFENKNKGAKCHLSFHVRNEKCEMD